MNIINVMAINMSETSELIGVWLSYLKAIKIKLILRKQYIGHDQEKN